MTQVFKVAKLALVTLAAFYALASLPAFAEGRVNGALTLSDFTLKFGSSPGVDQLDASGSYIQGGGNNGISLPAEAVVVSVDGGKFIEAIPSNSFSAISGGWKFQKAAGSSGVVLLKWMNNGTYDLDIRKSDFTGIKSMAYGVFTITVGDDVFAATPNSVPVGKITGSATGAVGTPQTLDASTSSDFNMHALNFVWSLFSQPLGSSVTLSSTTNPTTSLIPTHNGAYTVKLVPSDAAGEGIAALFTVQASGAAEEPPPAPGPTNGLLTLSTNQPEYLA